jgi:hypothetical protein
MLPFFVMSFLSLLYGLVMNEHGNQKGFKIAMWKTCILQIEDYL